MLTATEITRVVIKRSKLTDTVKKEWLLRRAIKPERVYTKREFRKLCREVMPVVIACVTALNSFIDIEDQIPEAEANYRNRHGEAPVDMVFDNVSARLMEHNVSLQPPPIRRTCTGYFGPSCTCEQVDFQEWEE